MYNLKIDKLQLLERKNSTNIFSKRTSNKFVDKRYHIKGSLQVRLLGSTSNEFMTRPLHNLRGPIVQPHLKTPFSVCYCNVE